MLPLEWRIGWFLAIRQIRRASKWTTLLIISVMTLTFLNLVVVSGILVGLIEGAVVANRVFYTGDVIVSNLNDKTYIENSPAVVSLVDKMPEVGNYSVRYLDAVTVEANYKSRTDEKAKPNQASASAVGINPIAEDELTDLSDFVIEGEYLSPTDYDYIMLGSNLLKKYLPIDSPGFALLENVAPGDKVRVSFGTSTVREMTVKGILKSKVDEISFRVYFVDSQLRTLIGRSDFNVDEISIKGKNENSAEIIKQKLLASGVGSVAKVQTFEDAQPKFLKDIKATFAILGNAISSIGLVVASITIFIVIFINALTRRKFIGILKGIGVTGKTIEISYVIQSFFYAMCGSAIGLAILYFALVPYFNLHPIDFPFSDGILVATIPSTAIRIGLLVCTTIIAGYIPARMIVRKNTLDSILGRN